MPSQLAQRPAFGKTPGKWSIFSYALFIIRVMKSRFVVVLMKPEHPANIGLVARNMKNTGFHQLRLVGVSDIADESLKTAVHAKEILDCAQILDRLDEATADCEVVFAATAKKRKNFSCLSLEKAVDKMLLFSRSSRVGLLFGNERTGLTSEELKYSNFRFAIPQATRQPSFNLASAVLITLFSIFTRFPQKINDRVQAKPLSRKKQVECIEMILKKLEEKGFVHKTNKKHTTEMIYDLFSRLSITEEDKKLLLAIFSKGVNI
jgi:TrmH family RNA methyltransferase